MKSYYRRWRDQDSIDRFSNKGINEFFRTEHYFIDRIASEISSVLDIGCASGHFIKFLCNYCSEFDYTGIDIVEESIENARKLYSESRFLVGNALDLPETSYFDLVNATGVCQHEPDFESLIAKMAKVSRRFVLFDVKLAKVRNHIVDINTSFCREKDNRVYFILLSFGVFLRFLRTLPNIGQISVVGYGTPTNRRTVVPGFVGPVVSAGVLLEKTDAVLAEGPEISTDLPEAIMALAGATPEAEPGQDNA